MSIHYAARVTQIEAENYRVKTLTLDLALPAARPGQFAMVWLPGINERPFSFLSRDPVRFTVARVGEFSTALHTLRVGDRLWVRGPLGNGFRLQGRHLLLAGGGYGVAPIFFLATEALAAGAAVSVAIGARRAADLLFEQRFRALGVPVALTTDDGSAGLRGLVTVGLERLTAAATSPVDQLCACGPGPMLAALAQWATQHGVPAQLSWENKMRCALGICGVCEQDGWLVCREGPVRHLS